MGSIFVTQMWAAMALGAATGALNAAVNGGSILKGACLGAFSAGAGFGGNILGAMLAGGVIADYEGGSFAKGFLSAGVGALSGGSGVSGLIRSAVIGGVVSRITGGKFKNGAASGAFMFVVQAGANRAFEDGSATANSGEFKSNHDYVDEETYLALANAEKDRLLASGLTRERGLLDTLFDRTGGVSDIEISTNFKVEAVDAEGRSKTFVGDNLEKMLAFKNSYKSKGWSISESGAEFNAGSLKITMYRNSGVTSSYAGLGHLNVSQTIRACMWHEVGHSMDYWSATGANIERRRRWNNSLSSYKEQQADNWMLSNFKHN